MIRQSTHSWKLPRLDSVALKVEERESELADVAAWQVMLLATI